MTAEQVAAQRQRVAERRTEAPALPDEIVCALAGVTFAPDYPRNVRALEREQTTLYWANPADPQPVAMRLEREPANEYDANAVAVYGADLIGHLPREVARRLAPGLDADPGSWSCVLDQILTNPNHVDRPGVRVRLARQHTPELPSHAGGIMAAVVAEGVGVMGWGEVHFELATRDLPVPDGIDAMRAALAEVYMSERNATLAERDKGE